MFQKQKARGNVFISFLDTIIEVHPPKQVIHQWKTHKKKYLTVGARQKDNESLWRLQYIKCYGGGDLMDVKLSKKLENLLTTKNDQ